MYIAGVASYSALFKSASSTAVIENVNLVSANITGSSYTAGFVGYNLGTLQNVSVAGTITTVGSSYAGGIVGLNDGGHIINAYSLATISTSNAYAGGLIGYNTGSGTIATSYSAGVVSSGSAGGLIGYKASGTVTDSFWDTETSAGASSTMGGTGKTTAQMKTQGTFTNWDFTSTWSIDSDVNSGYPVLRFHPPYVTNVTSSTADGLYGIGAVIAVDVTFSEAVTSTGDVTVTLETGATDRTCTFTVSNATTGSCNYTVQLGDATDDLTVNSVTGTIEDVEWNLLVNTTPVTNLADNNILIIETTAPTVAITSDDVENGGLTVGGELTFTATFSESVTGFAAADVVVENATLEAVAATDNASVYELTVLATTSNDVTIHILSGGAVDIAGNPNSASSAFSFTCHPNVTIDSFAVSDDGTITITYSNGETKSVKPFSVVPDGFAVELTPDKTKLIISNGHYLRAYISGVQVDTKTVGKTTLRKKKYHLKSKKLYHRYTTVVMTTVKKMTVFRLTAAGNFTKKRTVQFDSANTTVPKIVFKKKAKSIQLDFGTTQQVWKLQKNGALAEV